MHAFATLFLSGDPTNHGSNVGVVALFALGIFALIGLLAFLITRRGRRPLRPASARSRPTPTPLREAQTPLREAQTPAETNTTDATPAP
jgi:hypothetical protein